MLEQFKQALMSLQPLHLEVLDESYMHSVGENSHFKVVIVADVFADLRPVQRHQKVYAALGVLMQSVHAVALHVYSPQEWQESKQAPCSPQCRGGGLLDL